MSAEHEGEYLGDIAHEELEDPAAGRASGPDEPSPGAAAMLGVDLGEVKSEVTELRAQLQDVLARNERTAERLHTLAETVANWESSGPAAHEEEDQRPLDWVQVASDQRRQWAQDRVEWVHDVLMSNWADLVRPRLRPCWPLHISILNDMSHLQWLYEDGFINRRLLSANDFRRTLEVLLDSAELTTQACPQPGSEQVHPVPQEPRDDSAQVDRLQRDLDMARAYALFRQAQAYSEQVRDPEISDEQRVRARTEYDGLAARLNEILRRGGISKQEWEAFRAQAEQQAAQAHAVFTSTNPGQDERPRRRNRRT